MKVLLVTGRLMEDRVRQIAETYGHDVFVAPVDIAAFVKARHLKNISDHDLILVPGYSGADLYEVERITSIRTAKGPKDLSNLDVVLENLPGLALSKTVPACEMLKKELAQKALSEIAEVDSRMVKKRLLKKPGNFTIGRLAAGLDFPMRVIAEIVDADLMTDSEVFERAKYYLAQGADIIDIGISTTAPLRVSELVKTLRSLSVPLSVDTMEADNIRAAIEAEADMILSLDPELINTLTPTDIPVVLVPGKEKFNTAEDQLKALEKNIKLARSRGFGEVIADPILRPIGSGAAGSISLYRDLGDSGNTPMLMGVGNVTELLDADSTGINAALAGIAMECGVSLLLTTEASDKTRGSVKELKTAALMMFLAKIRKTHPKDLGIDLLCYKEKTRPQEIPTFSVNKVHAKKSTGKRDPLGDFTILIDDNKIVAIHSREGVASIAIMGDNARDICDTIMGRGLISEMSHATYLGRELDKAEIALQTGRGYVQDAGLF